MSNQANPPSDKDLFSETFMKSGLFKKDSMFQTHLKKADENAYTLKEGAEITEGLKVTKFLKKGRYSKLYLATINQGEIEVLLKNFSYTPELIEGYKKFIDTLENIRNDNLLVYFDYDINKKKKTCYFAMEYLADCISLQEYFQQYNKKKSRNTGLPMSYLKKIMKAILSGLVELHANEIYPGNLQPKNILVNSNLTTIKLINYAYKSHVEENFLYPYYTASKKLFSNFIEQFQYENDIWSVGCIFFELFCGYSPYYKFTPQKASGSLAQYITPLEAASEEVKDIFYDKKNRTALDFCLQCFRFNDGARPTAKELLEHKLFKE